MRSIGLPEFIVLAVINTLVWFFVMRGRQQPVAGSRTCASCHQRVPDVGSFCSFCGQKTA